MAKLIPPTTAVKLKRQKKTGKYHLARTLTEPGTEYHPQGKTVCGRYVWAGNDPDVVPIANLEPEQLCEFCCRGMDVRS